MATARVRRTSCRKEERNRQDKRAEQNRALEMRGDSGPGSRFQMIKIADEPVRQGTKLVPPERPGVILLAPDRRAN